MPATRVTPEATPHAPVPDGFEPLRSPGAFLAGTMPMFCHATRLHAYGMRIEPRHLNPTLITHGGVLATFADTALGTAAVDVSGRVCHTANLSVDYLAPSRPGDWIEAEVTISKNGRRMLFADCHVLCNGTPILRASAVFVLGGAWTWPDVDAAGPA